MPDDTIKRMLLESAPRDIEELLSQLQPRADQAAGAAEGLLAERGETEMRMLAATLEEQRERVLAELNKRTQAGLQLSLEFSDEERKQVEANVRAWHRRIESFDQDIESEPGRVKELFEVATRRVEPLGLVYLWPDTN